MAAVRALPGFLATPFGANDDESVGPVSLGFSGPINYFGTSTSTAYVNNNGNLTFDGMLRTYKPFDLSTTDRKILAPFFADVQTFGNNVVRYGNDTVNGRKAFGVEWPGVGYYSSESKRNFFELIIIERFDTGPGNFDVEFNYDEINWETGSSSGGSGGLGGNSARVGFASGNNGPFREFAGSAVNGAFLDSNTTTGLVHNRYRSTTPGRYVLTVRGGAVVDPDLQVESVQATNLPAVSGSTVNVQWVVKNTGNDPTPNSWSDRVRIVNRATGTVVADQMILYDLLASGNGAIAPGASRTRTTSVQLPHGMTGVGTFDVTVTTDAIQQIFEANSNNTSESNNTATGSFTSTLAPYPNLGAQNQGVPTEINALQSFEVIFKVNNSGTGTATGSWKDRVYLSTTQTITSNSILLNDFTSLLNLAVNASYQHVFDVVAPQVAEGNYFIITVANHDEAIFELDRSNNLVATPIHIARPDLKPRIEVFQGSVPLPNATGSIHFGSTAANQTITKSFTIRNTGPTEMTLGNVTVSSASDFSITIQPNAAVPPNGQTSFEIRLNGTRSGVSDAIVSIPNNDPAKNPFTFNVLGFVYDDVDLVVTDIQTSPTSIVSGQVDVTWTVKNQGAGEFRGIFSDKVLISSDAQIGNDSLLSDFTFDGTLTAGQSVIRTQRVTLPSNLAGLRYLVIRTDVSNQVIENNSVQAESNNVTIDDQGLNILAADLQPFDVEVASVLPTGSTTQVSWKVKNVGSAATLTGATWQDEVFLSSDKIFDATDTLLALKPNPNALSAMVGSVSDSYASFADVTIPYGTSGVRYLIVRTDSRTSIVELNESNNAASSNATNITWQPPDLQVEKVISQAFAFTGAPTRVSWDVRNAGRSAMLPSEAAWKDRLYLSTDMTLDAQDRVLGEFTHTGLLLPGEGYTQALDVTLPVGSVLTAGDYFLIVETDWDKKVKEGLFESNNWTSETSTTRVVNVAPPDLVVDSIGSLPTTIFAGQTLDVSFQVKNAGAGDTEPTNTRWVDAVYLSTNDTLESTDRLLGTISRNGGLTHTDPPYGQSGRFSIPSDLVGAHKLIVVTNIFGEVFGDDVSNNKRVTTSSINIQKPPADLEVISVTTAASTVVVGSPLTVNFAIRNLGPQATTVTNWTDRIFLSRDSILDSDDIPFANVVRTGALAAGAEYQGSATKTIDQVGAFHVLVQSDATGAVFEIVDGNNVGITSGQVNVIPIPADLMTSHLVVPSAARSGSESSISYRVTNTGPTPTLTSNWMDRIYLSTDATLDTSDRLLKSVFRYGKLDASPEFYEVTTSFDVPDGLTGQYHIIVHADALNSVFEQDNVDNVAVSTGKVTLASTPADLVVTSIASNPSIMVGQSLRVDWTVKNQGTGDTIVPRWNERVYLSDDNVFNAQSDLLLRVFEYTNTNNSVDSPLDPNKSINRSEIINFADNVLGDKFLFIVVDSTDVVFEPQHENNNVSLAQPIKLVQRDTDLQVFNVTAPASATEGVAFDVSWIVRNVGTDETNAAFWYDEVYVSTDKVLSANDLRLGAVRRSNPLNGTGQSNNQYTVTRSFAIPIGVTASAAPFFVLVKTDSGTKSLVPEILEDNNATASASATAVSPGTIALLPDLSVTSVGLSSRSAQVGQPITLNWTVRNSGPGNIANGSWFDSVYLSLDQVLDRQNSTNHSRDIFLGTKEQVRSLSKNASYIDSGTFTIPSGLSGDYFVLVGTDFRNDIAEGTTVESNNVGVGTIPLSVQPKAPTDIVVGTITIPATGTSGGSATIAYTVANNGQNPAIGSWYDAIYISADATWDVEDTLFGRVLHTGNVLPLATYSESLTANLPGFLPGNYHVIIRSDIRNQIAESNEQNNLKATLSKFALDVPSLTLGTAATGTLSQGQYSYYKVDVPAGETLSFVLNSNQTEGANEVYVAFDRVPTRSNFDFAAMEPYEVDQRALVPSTQAGTYYVAVYANSLTGASQSFDMTAKLLNFGVFDSNYGRGGNAGDLTIEINGSKFDRTVTARIVDSTGVNRPARQMWYENEVVAYATFDLRGLAPRDYDVVIENGEGKSVKVPASLRVVTSTSSDSDTIPRIDAPLAVRRQTSYSFTVNWTNDSLNDVLAPLLSVGNSVSIGTAPGKFDQGTQFEFLGTTSNGGPAGILRPGQSNTRTFYSYSNTDDGTHMVFVDRSIKNPTAPFDWGTVVKAFLPTGTSNDIVTSIEMKLREEYGSDYNGYHKLLSTAASTTWNDPSNPSQILNEEIQRIQSRLSNGVLGQVTSVGLMPPSGFEVHIEMTESGIRYVSRTDRRGRFFFSNLPEGNYRLNVDRFNNLNPQDVSFEISPGQSVDPITVSVSKVPSVSLQIDVIDGQPLRNTYVQLLANDTLVNTAITDTSGKVTITGVGAGTYDLVVWAEGGGTRRIRDIVVTDAASDVIEIELANATLRGTLLSPDLYPVLVSTGDVPEVIPPVFNSDNGFEIHTLAGDYTLQLFNSNGDRVAIEGSYSLESGSVLEIGSIGNSLNANNISKTGLNSSTDLWFSDPEAYLVDSEGVPLGHVKNLPVSLLAKIHLTLIAFRDPDLAETLLGPVVLAGTYLVRGAEYVGVAEKFLTGGGVASFGEGTETVGTGFASNPGFRNHPKTKEWLEKLLSAAKIEVEKLITSGEIVIDCEQTVTHDLISILRGTSAVNDGLLYQDGNMPEEQRWLVFDRTLAGGVGHYGSPPEYRGTPDTRSVLGGTVNIRKAHNGNYEVMLTDVKLHVHDAFDFWPGNLGGGPEESDEGDGGAIIQAVKYATTILLYLEFNRRANDVILDINWTHAKTESVTLSITGESCKDEKDDHDDKAEINRPASRDPNDIIGPSGFGPENWIAATQPLNYTIRFENDPIFATAPAQRIAITQKLDSDLDPRSFRLGDFGIGEFFVDVPENQSFYSKRIDLRETKGIFVDAFAGINVATGEAFWTFLAVDPVTGDLPEDPLKGILPPNLNPPEGDGFVRYSVKAKSGVTTGTRIDAQARIVFDINEPIDTPPIFHTLDAVTPTSQVAPLNPLLVANQARFPVLWSGSDDANGSAIAGYDVYVNVDDKGFQPWLTNVTYTDALYDGPVGTTYAFYTVARDNAKNSETAPDVQDANIKVVAPRDVRIEIGNRTIASPGEVVEFSDTVVGATAVQMTLTVRNSGNEPLVLGSAIVTNNSEFTIVTNVSEGLSLDPNETALLVVRFNPMTIGSKSSTLQFGTNVTGKSPFTLLLRGDVVPAPSLQITVDNSTISENGGTTIVTLTRNTSTTVPLTANLTSVTQSRLIFPESVTIPVGASSASFLVRAIDNTIAEGTQSITILAAASGLLSGAVSVSVTNDDVAAISLTIAPTSISENGGTAIGTVSRNTPTTSALTVNIVSSNVSAATVPSTVVIPAGQTSVTFTVTGVNDAVQDGSQLTNITASATGLSPAISSVTVTDDDNSTIILTISPTSISENGGTATGTVSRNTPATSALTVNIVSSNVTAATVPSKVVIPAGQTSATFTITGVNDVVVDGSQSTNITASASGLTSATSLVTVTDDEVATLSITVSAASISENSGRAILKVTRNTETTSALLVELTSTDDFASTIPRFVTIPIGQTSVEFEIISIDDFLFDGDRVLTIFAGAVRYKGDFVSVTIVDEETKKPATNPKEYADVNADDLVSALDVLIVINALSRSLNPPLIRDQIYMDVNGDLVITSLDALLVINYLYRHSSSGGEAEDRVSLQVQQASPHVGLDNQIDLSAAVTEKERTQRLVVRDRIFEKGLWI